MESLLTEAESSVDSKTRASRRHMDATVATNYQFGRFEVRVASGELLRDGVRVRLQDQPFRLLVILLERSGEVVSRDEIRRRIWPENTFVDFDASLRVAVGKLRDALGDDADSPIYVETIPKRGYRFLQTTSRPAAAEQAPVRRAPWIAAATAAALVAAAAGAYLLLVRRAHPVLTDKDTVVLADFANSTGDPVFDATLRQGLIAQLEQSPFLSLVSDERIQQMLRRMAQPPETPLSSDVAMAICERTGSAAVLDGSIARLGSQYVIGLRAKNCRTGAILDQQQTQVARKEDVLTALGTIAGAFRRRLGESLADVEKFDTPLPDATTGSLEALRAYGSGMRALASNGSAAAIPLFKQAVEIDPGFATAHAWLGRVYGDVGEFELSAESTTKAYQLGKRSSQVEQYFIAASYDMQVSGNLEKAQQTAESWAQAYPRASMPHLFLSGIILPSLGAFDRVLEHAKLAVADDPDFWVPYYLLAYAHQYRNDFDAAERALDQAAGRKLQNSQLLVERYDLAFLKDDAAAMEAAVAQTRGDPDGEYAMADHQAFVFAYRGRVRDAIVTADRAAAMALQSGRRETAAEFQAGEAIWHALYGDAASASRAADAATRGSRARDVEYGAAVALALAGDSSGTQKLAADLEARFPEDTNVKFNNLPTIRALVAVNERRPDQAIDLLRMTAPYDISAPRSTRHAFFGALYPVYARGLAYLALHRGTEAAAEFQKIVDHRGVVVSDPVGALARYQLARAHAMAGETAKSKAAYDDVLQLWEASDATAPVVQQAKAEYRALVPEQ